MARYEIQIEIRGQQYIIDTYGDEQTQESIYLNYDIADIKDISTRKSGVSSTIPLPETDNNRFIFGNISDLNVDLNWNPNIQTPCVIMSDSVVIFQGYLQLSNATLKEDGSAEYETTVYSGNDNFWDLVGEGYISDMTFSMVGLNNGIEGPTLWTYENIVYSWTQSWEWGYYYPLIDYGYNWQQQSWNGLTNSSTKAFISTVHNVNYYYITEPVNTADSTNFFPAIYVKKVWDTIFQTLTQSVYSNGQYISQNVPYSYQSEFLNSDVFENLLIPFSRPNLSIVTGSSPYDANQFYVGEQSALDIQPQLFKSPFAEQYFYSPIIFNNESGIYPETFFVQNDCYTYSETDSYYTNTSAIGYAQSFNISVIFYLPVYCLPEEVIDYTSVSLSLYRSYQSPYQAPYITASLWNIGQGFPMPTYQGNTSYIKSISDILTGPTASLIVDGTTTLFYEVTAIFTSDWYDGRDTPHTPIQPGESVRLSLFTQFSVLPTGFTMSFIIDGTSTIYNTYNQTIVPYGGLIDFNQVLPLNVKKKDFITNIIKMFNLYIEPSKIWNNTLIIEPRPDYYENGVILDWTDKIDLDSDITEQILSETQPKTTLFTYTKDNDFYNTDYQLETTGQVYGQYRYVIDNDYLTSQQTIGPGFSPTPIVQVPGNYEIIIPKIGQPSSSSGNLPNTSTNIRIVTRNYNDIGATSPKKGLIQINNSVDYWFLSTTGSNVIFELEVLPNNLGSFNIPTQGSNAVQQTYYPYVGMVDYPLAPTYDLSYGQTELLYYIPLPPGLVGPSQSAGQQLITNNNLYTLYWQQYIEQISDKDSRLVKCKMFLNAYDISTFYFNSSIYLIINGQGQYYQVNKISNYDPTQDGLCDVELLKVLNYTVPKNLYSPIRYTNTQKKQGYAINDATQNTIIGIGNAVLGKANVVTGDNVFVAGKVNYALADNIIVIGTNNQVQQLSENSVVVGESNTIGNFVTSSMIVGSTNYIASGLTNVAIFGDNLYPSRSNSFSVQAPLVNAFNVVDAGEDSVLNAFSDIPVNIIDAGLDVVRRLGSSSPINIIDAGLDSVLNNNPTT